MRMMSKKAFWRVWLPGSLLLQLGGCLSDQQLTSILQSAVSTGVNTLLLDALDQFLGSGTA